LNKSKADRRLSQAAQSLGAPAIDSIPQTAVFLATPGFPFLPRNVSAFASIIPHSNLRASPRWLSLARTSVKPETVADFTHGCRLSCAITML
jgi:hypothetical protein